MKQTILMLSLLISALYSHAQCDKTTTYVSGKAEFTDTAGKVERSEEAKVVVKISKTNIVIKHNDDDNDTMTGEITGMVCNWKDPYKNGTTTFNTQLIERSGESDEATVSIKGTDGKLVLLIYIKKWGKIIKLVPDSHTEE